MLFSGERLTRISGKRLTEARAVRGLSLEQLLEQLPSDARLTKGRLSQIATNPGPCQTREAVLQALARALGVTAGWLRGEDTYPIAFRGWSLHPANLRGEVTGMSLRRAMVLKRCLAAARRDYQLLEGKPAAGEEWRELEQRLFLRFFVLLSPGYMAARFHAWPADRQPKPAEPAPKSAAWAEDTFRAAADYWDVQLEPWFAGRMGFNYAALPDLPFTLFKAHEATVSPTVLLERAPAEVRARGNAPAGRPRERSPR